MEAYVGHQPLEKGAVDAAGHVCNVRVRMTERRNQESTRPAALNWWAIRNTRCTAPSLSSLTWRAGALRGALRKRWGASWGGFDAIHSSAARVSRVARKLAGRFEAGIAASPSRAAASANNNLRTSEAERLGAGPSGLTGSRQRFIAVAS